jgi:hypothetical protein
MMSWIEPRAGIPETPSKLNQTLHPSLTPDNPSNGVSIEGQATKGLQKSQWIMLEL